MRGRWFVPVAGLLFLSACGGGGMSRAPLAPSNAIPAPFGSAQGPVVPGASTVSWECFSRLGSGTFGASGCPARVAPLRVQPRAGAPLTAPSAPTALSASVALTTVTLNWVAPASGDAPTSYVVQAGSAAGLTDIASFDTGGATTSLVVVNVPAGGYFVRIRALNSAGTSGPTNEILVIVAGAVPCVSLAPPTGVAANVTADTVVLSWAAPLGCPPTRYVIQVGSAPGLSNVANFSTGSDATTFTATGVPLGTYYLRLLSATSGLVSPPSIEVTFSVSPAPPPPPAAASAAGDALCVVQSVRSRNAGKRDDRVPHQKRDVTEQVQPEFDVLHGGGQHDRVLRVVGAVLVRHGQVDSADRLESDAVVYRYLRPDGQHG